MFLFATYSPTTIITRLLLMHLSMVEVIPPAFHVLAHEAVVTVVTVCDRPASGDAEGHGDKSRRVRRQTDRQRSLRYIREERERERERKRKRRSRTQERLSCSWHRRSRGSERIDETRSDHISPEHHVAANK